GYSFAREGWFTELASLWPGQGLSLRVEEILFEGKSSFQDICVFHSEAHGRVLVLDGVIQCTERDEFAYQEMLVHLAMCAAQEAPRRVLVVGGGDGGVLREVSRHHSVEKMEIAEIDGKVIEVAKEFFPKMAIGFEDPRADVHVCDGLDYVKNAAEGIYDVIIVDSSDPIGPAEVLFEKTFFENMHRALKPGGIVATQAESLWLHLNIIEGLAGMCNDVFQGGSVSYGYTTIPTYPSGQIGFMVCSKRPSQGPPLDPRECRRPPPSAPKGRDYPPLRYYNSAIHRAAFVLPEFASKALAGKLSFQ
ncbi:unnamed protein product, partial [Ostreobium quekettii]